MHIEYIVRCKQASCRIAKRQEPNRLTWSDGKRPDGLPLISWQEGRSLWRNVTVSCHLADSYVQMAGSSADAVGELATYTHKAAKYSQLDPRWILNRWEL